MSLVWFDEVDLLKCSRSASQLSFTNLLFLHYYLKVNLLDCLTRLNTRSDPLVRKVDPCLECTACGRTGHTSRSCALNREALTVRDQLFWSCVDPNTPGHPSRTTAAEQDESEGSGSGNSIQQRLSSSPDMFGSESD